MNNMVAGIGDVLLRYPELIEDLTDVDRVVLDTMPEPYIAVHLGASQAHKVPPDPKLLLAKLLHANVRFVVVGHDSEGPAPKLRMHIEIVKRAVGFLGTLSCFNCVAQLAKVPSFVIVNRAVKEPFVYNLMQQNGARIEAWNVIDAAARKPVVQIYDEAVMWARGRVLLP